MKFRKNKPMRESYSDIWSDNAWDAYDIAMEYLGAEGLCEALAKAMGTDALASNLKYIFRVNEIPFMDDEAFDESYGRKRLSKKKESLSNRSNKRLKKEFLYKYNPTKESRYMQQDLRGIYVGDDVSELDEELTNEGYFVAQSGHCLSPRYCDYKTWSNEKFVITVYYNRETHIVDTIYVEDMDQ